MRLLSFPFFFVYLIFVTSLSFVRMFCLYLSFFTSFFVVLGLVGVFTLNFLFPSFSQKSKAFRHITSPFAFAPITVTEEQVATETQYWEALRELQPLHRDILLNLSYLNVLLDKKTKAIEYYDQAHELDPNNPIFTTIQRPTDN